MSTLALELLPQNYQIITGEDILLRFADTLYVLILAVMTWLQRWTEWASLTRVRTYFTFCLVASISEAVQEYLFPYQRKGVIWFHC